LINDEIISMRVYKYLIPLKNIEKVYNLKISIICVNFDVLQSSSNKHI